MRNRRKIPSRYHQYRGQRLPKAANWDRRRCYTSDRKGPRNSHKMQTVELNMLHQKLFCSDFSGQKPNVLDKILTILQVTSFGKVIRFECKNNYCYCSEKI